VTLNALRTRLTLRDGAFGELQTAPAPTEAATGDIAPCLSIHAAGSPEFAS
jgi:hypothetical protein